MPSPAALAIWGILVALIIVALVQGLRHPWAPDAGVPRAARIILPLTIAALAVAVITWVVFVTRA